MKDILNKLYDDAESNGIELLLNVRDKTYEFHVNGSVFNLNVETGSDDRYSITFNSTSCIKDLTKLSKFL